MVFYSKNEKIYHFHDCHHIAKISSGNLGAFETEQEAREAGLHACACCSPLAKAYRKEKKAVESYADSRRILCYLRSGEFTVITEHSHWKLITEEGRVSLYHKNTQSRLNDCLSTVPGYHKQAIFKNRLQDYLNYIHEHDIYRAEEERRLRHNREFMQNTYAVCSMRRSRYNASQLYGILDGIAI